MEVLPDLENLKEKGMKYRNLFVIFDEVLKNQEFISIQYKAFEILFKKESSFIEKKIKEQDNQLSKEQIFEILMINLRVYKDNIKVLLELFLEDFFKNLTDKMNLKFTKIEKILSSSNSSPKISHVLELDQQKNFLFSEDIMSLENIESFKSSEMAIWKPNTNLLNNLNKSVKVYESNLKFGPKNIQSNKIIEPTFSKTEKIIEKEKHNINIPEIPQNLSDSKKLFQNSSKLNTQYNIKLQPFHKTNKNKPNDSQIKRKKTKTVKKTSSGKKSSSNKKISTTKSKLKSISKETHKKSEHNSFNKNVSGVNFDIMNLNKSDENENSKKTSLEKVVKKDVETKKGLFGKFFEKKFDLYKKKRKKKKDNNKNSKKCSSDFLFGNKFDKKNKSHQYFIKNISSKTPLNFHSSWQKNRNYNLKSFKNGYSPKELNKKVSNPLKNSSPEKII